MKLKQIKLCIVSYCESEVWSTKSSNHHWSDGTLTLVPPFRVEVIHVAVTVFHLKLNHACFLDYTVNIYNTYAFLVLQKFIIPYLQKWHWAWWVHLKLKKYWCVWSFMKWNLNTNWMCLCYCESWTLWNGTYLNCVCFC